MRNKILIISSLLLLGFGCTQAPATEEEPINQPPAKTTNENLPSMSTENNVLQFPGALEESERLGKQIRMNTEKGEIVFELFGDEAPLAVSNFVYLTGKEFYNGLVFHRFEPGFVIQGGDPSGNGTGGPGYRFNDEPVTQDYLEGIVAMANAGPNTNGSQFFIMLADNLGLPKNYTVFGKVTSGLDVVHKIRPGDKMITVTVENIE